MNPKTHKVNGLKGMYKKVKKRQRDLRSFIPCIYTKPLSSVELKPRGYIFKTPASEQEQEQEEVVVVVPVLGEVVVPV